MAVNHIDASGRGSSGYLCGYTDGKLALGNSLGVMRTGGRSIDIQLYGARPTRQRKLYDLQWVRRHCVCYDFRIIGRVGSRLALVRTTIAIGKKLQQRIRSVSFYN